MSFQKTSEGKVAKDSCCGEARRKKGRGMMEGKGERADIMCSKLVEV